MVCRICEIVDLNDFTEGEGSTFALKEKRYGGRAQDNSGPFLTLL